MSRSGRARRPALGVLAAALVAAPLGAAAPDGGVRDAAVPPPPSGALLATLSAAPAPGSLASQRVYFVMTDRYANGDPRNDRGGRTGVRAATGFDPADSGWFHGGDLAGLRGGCETGTGLARIKALGFTAVWLTPPFGQKAVQGSSAAYHGYWIRDFTSVDPHLGTNDEFGELVACAHRLGLKVYVDVVVNHTADVILLSGSQYSNAPYRDCRGRVFRPARYAGGKTFPCLRASGMPREPILLAADRAAKKPAWLNDVRRYHNRGDIDFAACSPTCLEQGDFFGLDDLFTEQPAVVSGLADVYADWITRYKLDGFRIDTAKHVDAAFFRAWVPKIMAAARRAGVVDFQLFGEVFENDAVVLSGFVRDRGLPNVLDFPLQDALTRFAGGSAGALGIAGRLDDDDYFRRPDGTLPIPPTFLGNHDVGRAARLISDRGGSGPLLLARVRLAHDLLYLLRGAPVVYYGDEVGIIGRGGDKQARQSLFPTQVAEWRTEERVGSAPIGAGSALELTSHPVGDRLQQLASLRDAHPALATGSTALRLAQRGVLVVSRFERTTGREYLAAFNAGQAAARVTVATSSGATRWNALLGPSAGEASPATGRLTLVLPPLGTRLLVAQATPAPVVSRPRLGVGPDDLTDFRRVTATLASQGPASVAFAVRRGRGAWRRLAVDDSPPYRAFLEPRRYRRGETVYLAAVARAADGRTATSAVLATRPRP